VRQTLASLLKPFIIFIWKYPCEPKSGTKARTRSESSQLAMKAMVSPVTMVPMFCTTSERVSAIMLFTAAASVERRAPIEPLQSIKICKLNGKRIGYGLTSKYGNDANCQGVTESKIKYQCQAVSPAVLVLIKPRHFIPHHLIKGQPT
jgi:hypothetical protein